MKRALTALANRRKRLVAQSAIQRHLVVKLGQGLQPALAWLDIGVSTWHLIRHHPWLCAGAGLLLSRLPFQAVGRPVRYLNRLWMILHR